MTMRTSSFSRRSSHAHHPVHRHRCPRPVLRPRWLRGRRPRRGQAPGAVRARRRARLHRRERRSREGDGQLPRSAHERKAIGCRALQLRRRRAPGPPCRGGRLRGPLPRQRRPGRDGQRARRRDDDRCGGARHVPRRPRGPGPTGRGRQPFCGRGILPQGAGTMPRPGPPEALTPGPDRGRRPSRAAS